MKKTIQKNDAIRLKKRIHFDPYADARAKHQRLPVIQIPSSFWKNMEPVVKSTADTSTSPLPKADVLVITWTTAETQALSAVFTSNHDFMATWHPYKNGFASIKNKILAKAITENKDTLGEGILGYYIVVTLNKKNVVLFKSELHPSQDGNQLPIVNLVQQITNQASPKLLITTGTAGAIGSYLQPGDAVITDAARFYLMNPKTYSSYPAITDSLALKDSITFNKKYMAQCNAKATGLIKPVLSDIASSKGYAPITRTPKIFFNNVPGAKAYAAVSSNGFSMDDKADTDGLQELGSFNEMNDAFVAFALSKGNKKVPWLSIRNMSEPQAPNLSEATKNKWADMYNAYGGYTTYNSAFACWSVIAGL